METASIELWHGSSHVIKHPEYGLVKPNNDYGRGFYCTRSVELAKEWACAGMDDGFANRYTLTTDGLLFLDLSQPPYTILNWLAMLVENRRFQPTTAVAAQGIEYLKQVFLPDASQADVIVGYRADDSYFSFARAFVNNAISIDQLAEAMRLGELGKQIVLASTSGIRGTAVPRLRNRPRFDLPRICVTSATAQLAKPTAAKVQKPISTACSCATSSARK